MSSDVKAIAKKSAQRRLPSLTAIFPILFHHFPRTRDGRAARNILLSA